MPWYSDDKWDNVRGEFQNFFIFTIRNSSNVFTRVCQEFCQGGGAYMVGGVHGGGYAWQGVCMAGGMNGGTCMAREACVVGSMHGSLSL